VAFGARIGIKFWVLVALEAPGGCTMDCAISLKAEKLNAEDHLLN
jgi:hypothetical protein